HWDFERNRPDGGRRWISGLGEIHRAYHTLQDAKAVLEEISQLEAEADRTANDYAAKNAAALKQAEKCDKFSTFASRLAVQSERKKTIDRIEKDQLKIADILLNWPKLAQEAQAAKALQTEKANRELLDKYEIAKDTTEGLKQVDVAALDLARPTDEEIAKVKAARRSIVTLENKLCGMNLNAAIKMLGANSVEVVSLRSGKVLDVTDDSLSITEAVKITVPGVMEMQLTPADVDVEAVREELSAVKAEAFDILGKYSVKTLDELEALAKKIDDVKLKVDNANNRLAMVLGTTTFEELEAKVKAIDTSVRPKNEIEREIILVAGNADIARYAAAKETMVEGYEAEYGCVSELKAKAYDLELELRKAKESVAAAEDIPAEYLGIADPEEHLREMQRSLKALQEQREAALTNKTAAASRLETFRENNDQDPVAKVEKAERAFEEQRSLLAHWKNILNVFNKQKENVHDNPMQDLADRFTKYLGVISGGKISSEFPEGDKLAMSVYSGNRLMDYKKLSEGTKDTVSLAFRLAVLDHLFPQGGGVIVLDDPFTDMDAERTEQACALLQECAKQHQVIFLTCKEEYLDMLGGNHIMM
ncbi:MAG: hypothetical protein J6Q99_05125, partial [Oscillospiraceae bacterium]|nr:hypothetical protein [Oscillospiraceae bacterium]